MKKIKKDIIINVELDKNKIPENIMWSAEDGGVTNQDVKALILSTWDFDKKETLKIDLWTKDMPLEHMNIFIYQTLVSLSKLICAQPIMKKYLRRFLISVIILLKN